MSKAKTGNKKVDGKEEKGPPKTRQEMFQEIVADAAKRFGEGAIQVVTSDMIGRTEENVLSTGIPPVDRVTNVGGVPRGRVIEVIGPESSGKTTLCLHTIAETQRNNQTTLYIDAEFALEPKHIHGCGVKNLHVFQPGCGEEALDMAEMACDKGTDLIVIDSVAALVPRSEIEGAMGDPHMGLQARLMSQALRKLTGKVAKSNSTLIFINQIRHKIGVTFGSPEVPTGGNALKFYASLRLDLRRKDPIKRGSDIIGYEIRVLAKKNKAATPLAESRFMMLFNPGETIAANAIDFGSKVGVVTKSGSWYSYKDERIGQGLANAVTTVVSKPDMLSEIIKGCRERLFEPIVDIADVL
jgi:recombination protein RecA